jgi:hypothetical protein
MGFLVFSNVGDFNAGGKTHEIADLFIKDTTTKTDIAKKEKRDSTTAILKDSFATRKFVGSYIGEDGLPFRFNIIRGKLYYHIYDESNFLIEDSKNNFSIAHAPNIKFAFTIKEKDTLLDLDEGSNIYHLKKYISDTSHADERLKKYTGTYYCPELDCKYGIVLKDHHLVLTNVKYNDEKLTLIGNDHLLSDYWWMNHLMMIRDKTNNIIGFEVNSGRIMHLRFDKLR